MIKVEKATQIYGKQVVFQDVNFEINPGERIAIVGRNGAGKTTFLHALLGFSKLKSGKITVDGKSAAKQSAWKGKFSYLPEKFQLYKQLTVKENIRFFADAFGLKEHEADEVLELTKMAEHGDKRITALSKGMLQRTGLSIAILGKPEWVVLDEPTSGLDPFGRRDVMELMKKIGSMGTSIIFTTHHMEEVREIATHVLYFDNKRIEKLDVEQFLGHFYKEVIV